MKCKDCQETVDKRSPILKEMGMCAFCLGTWVKSMEREIRVEKLAVTSEESP